MPPDQPSYTTAFSAYEWYTRNSARLDAAIAAESGTNADAVFWAMMDCIREHRLPHRGTLSLEEFERAFMAVACRAALERASASVDARIARQWKGVQREP